MFICTMFLAHCDAKMVSHVLVFLFILNVALANEQPESREGFMDGLRNGMKFAQNFLGSESIAHKVAEFVVKAFQTANRRPQGSYPPPSQDSYSQESHEDIKQEIPELQLPNTLAPLRHLVRLFGLQPNQISAVAVNALVFVAQMISTFLAGPKPPIKPYRSEDPTTWIMNKNSKQLQQLIAAAKNESLPDSIEDIIKEHGSEEETSCIRLLVCKITPYVVRMQKVVFGKEDSGPKEKGAKNLYRHLPTAEEINDRSDICERRYRNCDLNE